MRNTAIVTSAGDDEAKSIFKKANGVAMCDDEEQMIQAIELYSKNYYYIKAETQNEKFRKYFDWNDIALKVLEMFEKDETS